MSQHRAERCIEALKDVLWPPGREDEEWPGEALQEVVATLGAFGYVDEVLEAWVNGGPTMMPGLPKPGAPYDARLKVVVEEVREVLKRHNVAGVLTLSSDTHGEFMTHFPSWCGLQLEGAGVRIRIKKEEHAKAEATLKVLVYLRDLLAMNAVAIRDIFEQFRAEVERQGGEIFVDTEGTVTPDMSS